MAVSKRSDENDDRVWKLPDFWRDRQRFGIVDIVSVPARSSAPTYPVGRHRSVPTQALAEDNKNSTQL